MALVMTTTSSAIDEAQFFGPPPLDVVRGLAARGLHVIVAGLDVTFLGQPFGRLRR